MDKAFAALQELIAASAEGKLKLAKAKTVEIGLRSSPRSLRFYSLV